MPFDVPFIRPVFPPSEEIARDYSDIVASGWFSNFGPVERKLSGLISGFISPETFATTAANATLGLIGAVDKVFGQAKPGQRILMPSFTFAAGAQALDWNGYQPLFVDIDAVTFQPSLDHARILVARYPNVSGILFCNTFGIGDERIDEWIAAANEWGLPIVIDSAAGFGSEYADGSFVGTRGDCEVFSFHATKPFAIGEGGAVVSRSETLIESVAAFENFGFTGSRRATGRGLNAKLSELDAAIGCRQFQTFGDVLEGRQAVAKKYELAIEGTSARIVPGLSRSSVCFATVIIENESDRQRTIAALDDARVEFRDYYNPPVHQHPRFEAFVDEDLPVTNAASHSVLSLPVHSDMKDSDLQIVLGALSKGLGK